MDLTQQCAQARAQILTIAAKTRGREIGVALFNHLGGVISGGPFQGLRLHAELSWAWETADLSAKLLGCYEAELQETMQAIINHAYAPVINIGCAEGYYAVGLARRMPKTRVLAFDTDASAQNICRQTAALNDVADRVEVSGQCDVPTLHRVLMQNPGAFLLLDCEGMEKQLLVPDMIPQLAACDFLVECHDCIDRSITPALQARFAATHELKLIGEKGRDPSRHPLIAHLSSLDRWLAVCEFRPEAMHWLLGLSRTARVS